MFALSPANIALPENTSSARDNKPARADCVAGKR